MHRQLIGAMKYRYGPETKPTEIHRDPERQYSKCNIQIIRTKADEVRRLVQNLHRYDTWPGDTKAFLELCESLIAHLTKERLYLCNTEAPSFDTTALE